MVVCCAVEPAVIGAMAGCAIGRWLRIACATAAIAHYRAAVETTLTHQDAVDTANFCSGGEHPAPRDQALASRREDSSGLAVDAAIIAVLHGVAAALMTVRVWCPGPEAPWSAATTRA